MQVSIWAAMRRFISLGCLALGRDCIHLVCSTHAMLSQQHDHTNLPGRDCVHLICSMRDVLSRHDNANAETARLSMAGL